MTKNEMVVKVLNKINELGAKYVETITGGANAQLVTTSKQSQIEARMKDIKHYILEDDARFNCNLGANEITVNIHVDGFDKQYRFFTGQVRFQDMIKDIENKCTLMESNLKSDIKDRVYTNDKERISSILCATVFDILEDEDFVIRHYITKNAYKIISPKRVIYMY